VFRLNGKLKKIKSGTKLKSKRFIFGSQEKVTFKNRCMSEKISEKVKPGVATGDAASRKCYRDRHCECSA
jgi:hypothetical protein